VYLVLNFYSIIALFFIVPFFGFFTIKLGFSPVYVTFLFSAVFCLLGVICELNVKRVDVFDFVNFLLIAYGVTLYLMHWKYAVGFSSAFFNFIFSLLYLLVMSSLINRVNRNHVLSASWWAIVFSISLLSVEMLIRLGSPSSSEEIGHFDRDDIFWYIYKSNSFMYPDSNSIGLFASCLFVFALQLGRLYGLRLNLYLAIIFVILLGSISRASIMSTLAVVGYMNLKSDRLRKLYILVLLVVSCFILVFFPFKDESLLSRFWIAGLVFDYLSRADLVSLLFGVGPGNAESVLNVGSHLLPFTLIVELGVLGSGMTILLWAYLIKESKSTSSPLFAVFILNGFAFTSFAIPWLYAMALILISLSKSSFYEKSPTSVRSFAGF
jgi:ABC-type multidrug transport system fused ATPase/permease subunit